MNCIYELHLAFDIRKKIHDEILCELIEIQLNTAINV